MTSTFKITRGWWLAGCLACVMNCFTVDTQAEPMLRLLSVDGSSVKLGWPASLSGGFVVERSPTVTGGPWTRPSGPGVGSAIVGAEVQAAQGAASAPIEFYRLRSTRPDEPLVLVVRMAGAGALDAGLLNGLATGAVILPGTNFADVLAAVPAAGAMVLLDAGVFVGGVTVPARVTLRGRGPDRTRIVAAAGESRPAVMVAGDDVTIEGVTLERLPGSGSVLIAVAAERAVVRSNVFLSSSPGLPLVSATAGSGHLVQSNRFESAVATVGVLLASGAGHGVAANIFRLPGSAVVLQGGGSAVANNDFRKPGGDASALVRLEGVTASGNVVSNNLLIAPSGVTVALATGAVGNRIEANRLVPGDVLVEASAGSGNVVVNNALRTLIAVSAVPPPWVGEIVGGVALETTNGVPTLWTGTLTNAVALIGSMGADVELGDGVFTGNVQLTTGVVLRGQGRERTKIVPLTPEQFPAVRVVGTNVVLENLTVDGDRANVVATAPTTNGVVVVSGANATLRNVAVVNARHHGVVAGAGASGLLVEGSVLDNGATNAAGTSGWHLAALWSRGADNLVVRSNTVRGWGQAVVLGEGSTNGLVQGNTVTNNYGYLNAGHTALGVAMDDVGQVGATHGANQWVSNVVDGVAGGALRLGNGVVGSQARGNVLRRWGQFSPGASPWEVSGVTSQPNQGVEVSGNQVESDATRTGSGRVVGTVVGAVISSNTWSGFEHASSLGPLYVSGGQGVRVVGNVVTGSRYGVWLNAGGTGLELEGNVFSNVRGGDAVIYLAGGGGVRVATNYVNSLGAKSGIKLVIGGGHQVVGNRVRGAGAAINSQTADNVIEGNVLEEVGTTQAGLVRVDGVEAVRNVVRGNVVVSGVGSLGVYLANGAANNTVEGNGLVNGGVVQRNAGSGNSVTLLNAPVVIEVSAAAPQFAPSGLGLANFRLSGTIIEGYAQTIAGAIALVPTGSIAVVSLEARDYAERVTLAPRVTLRGVGAGLTRLLEPLYGNEPVVSLSGASGGMESLDVVGVRTVSGKPATGSGLVMVSATNIVLRRVRVFGNGGHGLAASTNANGLLVESCDFFSAGTNVAGTVFCGTAVLVNGADNVTFRTNRISGWSAGVAFTGGVTNSCVLGNLLMANHGRLAGLPDRSGSVLAESGVNGLLSVGNIWEGNLVFGAGGPGATLGGGIRNLNFRGNVIQDVGRSSLGGVHINLLTEGGVPASSNLVIERNQLLGAGTRPEGLVFNGFFEGAAVRSNTFSDLHYGGSGGRGAIYVGGVDTKAVVVEGNSFTNCRNGVWLDCVAANGSVVRSNVFHAPVYNSSLVYVMAGNGHSITGNRMWSSEFVLAINLSAGAGHSVSGNLVRVAGTAVNLQTGNCQVASNDIREVGNEPTGLIRVAGIAATNNVITNNVLLGVNGSGVRIQSGADGNLARNNFALRGGVYMHPSAGVGNIESNNECRPMLLVGATPPGWANEIVSAVAIRGAGATKEIWTADLTNGLTFVTSLGADITLDDGEHVGNFVLPGNIVLRGRGRDRTVLKTADPARVPTLSVPLANVVIEDLTLDGRRSEWVQGIPEFYAINGVLDVNGTNVTVRRSRVTDAMGNGILVQPDANGFLIEDSEISNSATNKGPAGSVGGHGYGLFVSRAKNPVVRNNLISGWAQGVGLWWGVTNALVEQNQIVANYGFLDAAHTINRSACEDYGADVAPHGWNLWRSNLVDGTTSHCLEIAAGVSASRYVGNILRRPGQISNYGQHFEVTGRPDQLTLDVVVEGNDIVSEGLRADRCSVNGLAYRTLITNNVFRGFTHVGSLAPVFLGGLGGVRDTVIAGNLFDQSKNGVWLNADTSGTIIRGNVFTNLQAGTLGGISADVSVGPTVATNNVFASNEAVPAMRFLGGSNHVVAGNTALLPGQSLIFKGFNSSVTNNVFTETANSGNGVIRLEGATTTGNLVAGNRLSSLDSFAIYLLNGAAANTVTNNTILRGTIEINGSAGPGNIVGPN